ncbi:MAG TPA: peptidylprolyl isomerase [Flavipsychrobacter sp.]|nr:peptidylprolyl isomerase [Flavipsychrobacter sp.]
MKKIILTSLGLLMMLHTFAQKTKVEIETEYGKIVMMLYDNTPKHRDNMIKLVKEHFYDSTIFHRVIPQFVIQGGDPDSKHAKAGQMLGDGDLKYKIPAEINDTYYHKRGAVGMARDNNPEKASSACQFYIVVGKKFTDAELDKISQHSGRKFTAEQREVYKTQGGTPHLDGGYTVFGEVLEGMDVVDKIANEPRDAHDRPNKDIRMIKVRLVKKKKFLGIF